MTVFYLPKKTVSQRSSGFRETRSDDCEQLWWRGGAAYNLRWGGGTGRDRGQVGASRFAIRDESTKGGLRGGNYQGKVDMEIEEKAI